MADSPRRHVHAPIPPDEPHRLAQLRLLRVLDTEAEGAFDDLVQLAASVCETPIALLSLVDDSRQWFKSKVGLAACSTPRDAAFCAHAILSRDVLIVPDAKQDPRFAQNPLVLGEPGIRFYAGAPVVLPNGAAVGTVCVIDRQPRQLTSLQVQTLRTLRRTAAHLLELRRTRLDLEDMVKMLPVCSWCHSVKDDAGDWMALDRYVETAVPVTHSICPDCLQRELARSERG